jgi:hypothetical protein
MATSASFGLAFGPPQIHQWGGSKATPASGGRRGNPKVAEVGTHHPFVFSSSSSFQLNSFNIFSFLVLCYIIYIIFILLIVIRVVILLMLMWRHTKGIC